MDSNSLPSSPWQTHHTLTPTTSSQFSGSGSNSVVFVHAEAVAWVVEWRVSRPVIYIYNTQREGKKRIIVTL